MGGSGERAAALGAPVLLGVPAVVAETLALGVPVTDALAPTLSVALRLWVMLRVCGDTGTEGVPVPETLRDSRAVRPPEPLAVRVTLFVCVRVALRVTVDKGVAVPVGVLDDDGVWEAVRVALAVRLLVCVALAVWLPVCVALAVWLPVCVALAVEVAVEVAVAVSEPVMLGVRDELLVLD